MARAQAARAQMALAFETVYGLAPAGGFRAAFESVKAIWVQLDDIVGHAAIQSANALIAGVEAGINQAIALLNALAAQRPRRPFHLFCGTTAALTARRCRRPQHFSRQPPWSGTS